MNSVDEQRINELCQELRPFLDAELAVGNIVVDTWKGWPLRDSLCIMLKNPFSIRLEPLPDDVQFVAVDDPHYWKSELVCEKTHHALACGFGN